LSLRIFISGLDFTIASMNYKERLVKNMELKVGDIVEFKKYEDMTEDEIFDIDRDFFPKSGKITEIKNDGFFTIEDYGYVFNPGSVARVDINSLKPGDEVLVKANINEIFEDHIYVTSKIDKKSVVKIIKRKEPEHFIVKEDHYGMYIGTELELEIDKSKAKIYTSRDTAVKDAVEMFPYDNWEVIPYDN